MNISKYKINKLLIKEKNIDAIQVYYEDPSPGFGQITIICYGSAWTHFWAGIGDRTLPQFFCDCDSQYLIGKLLPSDKHTEFDAEMTFNGIKRRVLELRRKGEISRSLAKDFWKDANDLCLCSSDMENPEGLAEWFSSDHRTMADVLYGGEWWDCIMNRKTGDYRWLEDQIIPTVKEAFKQEGLA